MPLIVLIQDVLRTRFSATGCVFADVTGVIESVGLVDADVDVDDEEAQGRGLLLVTVPSVDDGEADANAGGESVSVVCWTTGRV